MPTLGPLSFPLRWLVPFPGWYRVSLAIGNSIPSRARLSRALSRAMSRAKSREKPREKPRDKQAAPNAGLGRKIFGVAPLRPAARRALDHRAVAAQTLYNN